MQLLLRTTSQFWPNCIVQQFIRSFKPSAVENASLMAGAGYATIELPAQGWARCRARYRMITKTTEKEAGAWSRLLLDGWGNLPSQPSQDEDPGQVGVCIYFFSSHFGPISFNEPLKNTLILSKKGCCCFFPQAWRLSTIYFFLTTGWVEKDSWTSWSRILFGATWQGASTSWHSDGWHVTKTTCRMMRPTWKDVQKMRELLRHYFQPFNLQHNRVAGRTIWWNLWQR